MGGLADAFVAEGFRFYLVGGIVRDLALGRGVSGDIDVTTDARPEDIRRIIDPWADVIWDQGARFGTIGARHHETMVEVTTHRAERYSPESRKPQVDFSTVIGDDLSRRDFTVNAMAIELPDWELIDPFDGRGDLAGGVLRTPMDPASSFTDDPLRMLRAARFCSGHALRPVAVLEEAMGEYADRLDIVSRERISDELRKFFAVENPGSGIELLQRTGVLARIDPVFPGPDADPKIEGRPFDRLGTDAALRWALLLWWVRADRPSAQGVLRSLRESSSFEREVLAILHAAVTLDGARPVDDAQVRRLVVAAGAELERGHELLAAADNGVPEAVWTYVQTVVEREGTGLFRAPLNGDQVMQLLGREGPVIGRALAHLLDCRLEEGPMDETTAMERLRSWWSDHNPDSDPDPDGSDPD